MIVTTAAVVEVEGHLLVQDQNLHHHQDVDGIQGHRTIPGPDHHQLEKVAAHDLPLDPEVRGEGRIPERGDQGQVEDHILTLEGKKL